MSSHNRSPSNWNGPVRGPRRRRNLGSSGGRLVDLICENGRKNRTRRQEILAIKARDVVG